MPRERSGDLRVVFFDAAGTLFHVKGSVGQIYLDHALKYGVNVSQGALQQGFQRAFADAPPMAFSVADPKKIKACERLWWFDVVHNVFYRAGMFEGFDQYFDEVFAYFSRPEAWTLYPETVMTLQALEQRGLELGIVSNFDSRLYEILVGLGIDRFFDSVTISSVAGAAKPSPQIFQRALTKHDASASEALHVGDSLREDAQGAAAAGLKALLLQREPEPVLLSGVETIRTLTEIVAFIEK
ncbi:MAG TPA: HAD-IA family hydrolase [Nitrospirales bacterium]|jgi:putative hydrolase of the HAD superfamily